MRLFSRWCEAAVNSFGTPALFSLARHALAAWLVVAWLSPTASAEIILDDFDDTAEVPDPWTGPWPDYKPAITSNVGDLAARREMSFSAAQTTPNLALDAGVQVPSVLSADFDGHQPIPPASSPIVTFSVDYYFDPIDLTEGGANNAFLFDFRSHEGTHPPSFFRMFARGPTAIESYEANSRDFPFSSTPFTAVIPFSDFGYRGVGLPATIDFSRLEVLSVNFYFRRLSDPDIEWSIELDRIRIGRVVPEPTTIVSITLTLSVLGGFRWARSSSRSATGKTCEFAGFLP